MPEAVHFHIAHGEAQAYSDRRRRRRHTTTIDTLALEERSYLVSSATIGASVRDLLNSREHVNAVILGSQMPGESGQSLALHAKEHRLPVVMISERDEAMKLAERHHLQLLRKPFRMGRLYDALDMAFASRTCGRREA